METVKYLKPKFMYLLSRNDGGSDLLFGSVKGLVDYLEQVSLGGEIGAINYANFIRRIREHGMVSFYRGSIMWTATAVKVYGQVVRTAKRIKSNQ
jgi:hypothetical protein